MEVSEKGYFRKTKDEIFDYGVNEIPNIKESRAAYKAFGKDPSRYRVSSEALIRRIGQGKGLYEVNTVVDVNNLISIESGFRPALMTWKSLAIDWYSALEKKERPIRESEKMR